KKDFDSLRRIFSSSLLIYVGIVAIVLIFAETVGLWFLKNKMVIPVERSNAAFWVYQFSVLSFVTSIISIPFNALIIAHENMKLFAYLSLLEVFLKLITAYLIVIGTFDKLIFYSVLIFFVTFIISMIYITYCKIKYNETRLVYSWNQKLLKTLLSYTSWNLFGAVAGVFNNHGINILLNVFFGPVINSSRAIAYQVNGVVNQFVTSFMTAARPQITKYYSSGEFKDMFTLVFRSSKFSFF